MVTETPTAAAARRDGLAASPYGHLDSTQRYIHETRDEAWLALLGRHGVPTLDGLRILELGCGEGSLLRTLLHYGADPALLTGVDIDAANVHSASATAADVTVAGATTLPLRDEAFDLAFAFTMFSWILEDRDRQAAAREALRVLRPGGTLVVYDFWTNPTNRDVRPLRRRELLDLFAPVEVERVTLAPPLVAALGGRRALCRPLERLPFLRTHHLALAVKRAS